MIETNVWLLLGYRELSVNNLYFTVFRAAEHLREYLARYIFKLYFFFFK